MKEAELRETETGLVPEGKGWFVLNLRDASWETMPGGGTWVSFQADGVAQQIGLGVHVLPPGEAPGRYHAEANQEGFLVLAGECILVVEGEERRLKQWDYFHCPPGTAHITIADPLRARPDRGEVRRGGQGAGRLGARGLRRPGPDVHAGQGSLARNLTTSSTSEP